MKSVTLRGRRWRIGRVKQKHERGGCEHPGIPGKEIDVPVNGTRRDDLDTIIHEALHACFWDIDEEAIEESATDIARFLWGLGWRKVDL